MEKIIRVGGVDVVQRSCTVAFNALLSFDGSSLGHQTVELTHNALYKLLETAKDVKAYSPKKGEETTRFCSFKQGEVEFNVYYKEVK